MQLDAVRIYSLYMHSLFYNFYVNLNSKSDYYCHFYSKLSCDFIRDRAYCKVYLQPKYYVKINRFFEILILLRCVTDLLGFRNVQILVGCQPILASYQDCVLGFQYWLNNSIQLVLYISPQYIKQFQYITHIVFQYLVHIENSYLSNIG